MSSVVSTEPAEIRLAPGGLAEHGPGKLFGRPKGKLLVVAAATAVLGGGWLTAPPPDAPTTVATPEERIAPLLEAEMARRQSLQVFERVQEMGGRVIGYSVAVAPASATAPRTVRDTDFRAEPPALPAALGVVASTDGLILSHADGLDGRMTVPVQLQTGAIADAEVLVFEEPTGLVLLRAPSTTDWPVAPLAGRRLDAGALATAAGRWSEADIIVPVFVMAWTPDRYRISGGDMLPPGTPLFNADGELFAVLGRDANAYPAGDALARLRGRLDAGTGHASALGVAWQERVPELAAWFGDSGVIVSDVRSDGPAGQAGLLPGDIILAVDGTPVDSVDAARRAIEAIPAGRVVTLSGISAGTDVAREVTSLSVFELRAKPDSRPEERAAPRLRDLLPEGASAELLMFLDARVLAIDGAAPRSQVQAASVVRRALRRRAGALLYLEDHGERYFARLPGAGA